MISKTPIGLPFFDAEYGGVYPNRVVLVTGRSGSGKTIMGLHFIAQGLRQQERALMLSTQNAQDLVITADSLGIPVASAVESGALTVLEYNEFVPGRDQEASIMLPPDGFIQLKEIIEHQAVSRVVIDTVLPWLTLPDPAHLPEHVFSLVRAFERLGVTALFTLPKPVSTAAVRLRRLVEDVVPVSLSLLHESGAPSRQLIVNKYLGMNIKPDGFNYDIVPQKGFIPFQPAAAAASVRAPVASTPAATHARLADTVASATGKGRASFASMVLNQSPAARPAAPGPAASPPVRGGVGAGGGG